MPKVPGNHKRAQLDAHSRVSLGILGVLASIPSILDIPMLGQVMMEGSAPVPGTLSTIDRWNFLYTPCDKSAWESRARSPVGVYTEYVRRYNEKELWLDKELIRWSAT